MSLLRLLRTCMNAYELSDEASRLIVSAKQAKNGIERGVELVQELKELRKQAQEENR